jgi:hypothetical protein
MITDEKINISITGNSMKDDMLIRNLMIDESIDKTFYVTAFICIVLFVTILLVKI